MHKLPSAQEVFNFVAAHLRKQGRPATGSNGRCAYRGDDGTSCAFGCLIPDEFYSSDFEGFGAEVVIMVLYKKGLADWRDHIRLLSQLQRVHDNLAQDSLGTFDQKRLNELLASVAAQNALEFTP